MAKDIQANRIRRELVPQFSAYSTRYFFPPGVANPASPSPPPPPPPSSKSGRGDQLGADRESFPQHWRKIDTVVTITDLTDPADPKQDPQDAEALAWFRQILNPELGPQAGPQQDLLDQLMTAVEPVLIQKDATGKSLLDLIKEHRRRAEAQEETQEPEPRQPQNQNRQGGRKKKRK